MSAEPDTSIRRGHQSQERREDNRLRTETEPNAFVPEGEAQQANVERWRMPSGSVASISLTDHPDAVQGARELLAMNGATLIVDREPVQAFAGDEYDEARAARAGMTAAQLDGVACVVCGREDAPQVPAGQGPRGQVFQCAAHSASSTSQKDALVAAATASKGENQKSAEDSVIVDATTDDDLEHLEPCPVFEWCEGHTRQTPASDGAHMVDLLAGRSSDGNERWVTVARYLPTADYDEPDRWCISMPCATEWDFDPRAADAEIDAAIADLQAARRVIADFMQRNGTASEVTA